MHHQNNTLSVCNNDSFALQLVSPGYDLLSDDMRDVFPPSRLALAVTLALEHTVLRVTMTIVWALRDVVNRKQIRSYRNGGSPSPSATSNAHTSAKRAVRVRHCRPKAVTIPDPGPAWLPCCRIWQPTLWARVDKSLRSSAVVYTSAMAMFWCFGRGPADGT
jgi:hypothetical protein